MDPQPPANQTVATPPPGTGTAEPWVEVYCSRRFPQWLAEEKISLGFTTYQTGKLFLFGRNAEGNQSIFERSFHRCMGLWSNGQTLWMSTLYQLWRFENMLREGCQYNGYDRVFVPKLGYTTGDVDVHDIHVDGKGRVVFACTAFNCLATFSDRYSFTPLWKPPFISKMAAEDRCHLNGLAMVEGRPGYVTVIAPTDVTDGWRDRRRDGGQVLDIASGQAVVTGLSMPHSPRWYRDTLWLLNSGEGFFGKVDLKRGAFEPIAFCPGYLRGLAFVGDYAVVGLSRPRGEKTFGGLALDDNLKTRGTESRSGFMIIDLRSGDIAHWVRVEGMVAELYDVVTLPGAIRPMALGFKTDEIQRMLAIGDEGVL